jgi:hypothetical protein
VYATFFTAYEKPATISPPASRPIRSPPRGRIHSRLYRPATSSPTASPLARPQQELAKRAGIRQETLSRIESGKHPPTLKKIDRALGKDSRAD